MNWKHILPTTLACGSIVLASCAVDETPLGPAPAPQPIELVVQIHIQPTDALRTVDTWANWTQPVDVAFVATVGDEPVIDTGGHGHGVAPYSGESGMVGVLYKTTSATEGGEILLGSIELPQMRVDVTLEDAKTMWEISHDGDLHEHHAESGTNLVGVKLVETATGHHMHGGTTVSHCEISLMAISATDTFEIHLGPVQTEHGLRYEANVDIPFDTYDMHIEVEPPEFLRDDETINLWVHHIEAEFHDFDFDSSFTSSTIGSEVTVGINEDSMTVTLRGGPVKIYGSVGIGAIPLTGSETVNFSVRLEDPTRPASEEQLYGSIVTVTITNPETGSTYTETLAPIFGHEGFLFGKNMKLGLDHFADDTGDGHDGH